MRGTIVKYFAEKGFGFVKSVNDDAIFFHISSFKERNPNITIGMSLNYNVVNTPKGLQAQNITIINNDSFFIIDNQRIKLSNISSYGIDIEKIYEMESYVIKTNHRRGFLGIHIYDRKLVFSQWKPISRIMYDDYYMLSTNNFLMMSDPELRNKLLSYNGHIILFDDTEQRKKIDEIFGGNDSIYYLSANEAENYITGISSISSKVRENENGIRYFYIRTYQNTYFKFYENVVSFDLDKKMEELDDLMSR